MDTARRSPFPGFQVAFLIFAVVLLNAPLDRYLFQAWTVDTQLREPLMRLILLASGALALAAFPAVRRRCAALLEPRIARSRWREVPFALALNLVVVFAAVGVTMLSIWIAGGEPALARRVGNETPPAVAMEAALTTGHLLMFVFVAGVVAPLVEELAFRGLLQAAWEPAWGWFGAAVATSIVFQAFHHLGVAQFIAGMVYTVLMRRTGTIRASIYAHSLFNLSLWYPLVGRFVVPAGASTGEISFWTFHLACLAVAMVALPAYLWSGRGSKRENATASQPA